MNNSFVESCLFLEEIQVFKQLCVCVFFCEPVLCCITLAFKSLVLVILICGFGARGIYCYQY